MAEQITINAVLRDQVSGPAATMAGNVSKSMKSVETSTAKSTKSLATMAKGFISFEVAMRAVRGLVTSVKEFERVSGGKVFKGLTDQFGQLQMEIASTLMPALQEFSDWFTKNAPQIMTVARWITNALVNSFTAIGSGVKLLSDTIAFTLEGAVLIVNGLITTLVKILNVVLLGALDKTVKGLEDFGKATARAMVNAGKDINTDAKGLGDSIAKIFTFDAAKGSGVKFISKEMQDMRKKLAEEREKLAKEAAEANIGTAGKANTAWENLQLSWVKSMVSVGKYKLAQLQLQHKRELAEIENYRNELIKKYGDVPAATPGGVPAIDGMMSNVSRLREKTVSRQGIETTALTRDVAKEARDEERSKWEARNDEITKGIDKYKESLQTLSNLQKELADAQLQYTTGMVQSIAQAQATVAGAIMSIAQYQMDLIDKSAEKQKAEATATVKGKRTLQRELDRIDADAAKKRAKFRKLELMGSLVSSVANTAEGITKAIAQGGILGLITGIAVGIAGAVQVGIISSQLSKVDQGMAYGGIVQGEMSGDKSMVKANAGEVILNTTQQRRLLALANGGGNGGGITIQETINVGGNLDMDAAERIRNDREKQLVKLKEDIKELSWRGQLQLAA